MGYSNWIFPETGFVKWWRNEPIISLNWELLNLFRILLELSFFPGYNSYQLTNEVSTIFVFLTINSKFDSKWKMICGNLNAILFHPLMLIVFIILWWHIPWYLKCFLLITLYLRTSVSMVQFPEQKNKKKLKTWYTQFIRADMWIYIYKYSYTCICIGFSPVIISY